MHVLSITGKTKLFPIVGHPVENVFSPPAFNVWFEKNDVDGCMIAMDVPPDGLESFLSIMRTSPSFLGCSVTYPHKQAALHCVDDLTPRAERLGVLNTIRRTPDGRLIGDATDGAALVTAMRTVGGQIKGKTAMILGAGGGAGMAIADAFCAASISGLVLLDTDVNRQDHVKKMIADHWPEVKILEAAQEIEILVNATSMGANPTDPCPFDPTLIAKADIICDVLSNPKLAELTKASGTRLVNGQMMGEAQVLPQLRFLGLDQRDLSGN